MAVDNLDAKELLKYLINAEEKHQYFLENEFNKQKDIGDAALRALPLDNLDEDGRLAIFSEPLDEVDPAQVGVEEALNYGINVEEKSIKFYNSALDIINDIELKKTIQDLVKFEHEHLDLLRQNLDEFRSSGNWRGYIATQ